MDSPRIPLRERLQELSRVMIKVIEPQDEAFSNIQQNRSPKFDFDALVKEIKHPLNVDKKILVDYPIVSISNLIYALKRRGLVRGKHYHLVHCKPIKDSISCITPTRSNK